MVGKKKNELSLNQKTLSVCFNNSSDSFVCSIIWKAELWRYFSGLHELSTSYQ